MVGRRACSIAGGNHTIRQEDLAHGELQCLQSRIVGRSDKSQFNRPFPYRSTEASVLERLSDTCYLAAIGANPTDCRLAQILTIVMKGQSGEG